MELPILLYLSAIAENMQASLRVLSLWALWLTIIPFFLLGVFTTTLQYDSSLYQDSVLSNVNNSKLFKRLFLLFFAVYLGIKLVSSLIPLSTNVYGMAAGYVALQAAKSETASSTTDHILTSIEAWLNRELSTSK